MWGQERKKKKKKKKDSPRLTFLFWDVCSWDTEARKFIKRGILEIQVEVRSSPFLRMQITKCLLQLSISLAERASLTSTLSCQVPRNFPWTGGSDGGEQNGSGGKHRPVVGGGGRTRHPATAPCNSALLQHPAAAPRNSEPRLRQQHPAKHLAGILSLPPSLLYLKSEPLRS